MHSTRPCVTQQARSATTAVTPWRPPHPARRLPSPRRRWPASHEAIRSRNRSTSATLADGTVSTRVMRSAMSSRRPCGRPARRESRRGRSPRPPGRRSARYRESRNRRWAEAADTEASASAAFSSSTRLISSYSPASSATSPFGASRRPEHRSRHRRARHRTWTP